MAIFDLIRQFYPEKLSNQLSYSYDSRAGTSLLTRSGYSSVCVAGLAAISSCSVSLSQVLLDPFPTSIDQLKALPIRFAEMCDEF